MAAKVGFDALLPVKRLPGRGSLPKLLPQFGQTQQIHPIGGNMASSVQISPPFEGETSKEGQNDRLREAVPKPVEELFTGKNQLSVDDGNPADDDRVHRAAEELDLEALKALPEDVLNANQGTHAVNENGMQTWAITNAVRSLVHDEGSHERRLACVDFLVDAGSSLAGALVFVAWRGNEGLARHLLDHHEVDVNGRVPLGRRNVDGTGNGETAIHGALIMGHVGLAKMLISSYNADINAAYDDNDVLYRGETALHIACVTSGLDMVQFLVKNGASLDAKIHEGAAFFQSRELQGFGQTPLTFAASCCRPDVVEFLLQEGRKQKIKLGVEKQIWAAKDSRGWNVFHHLARRTNRSAQDRLEVVEILDKYIEGGAANMIRNIDNEGYTAIAEAAKHYDKEFCEGLINFTRRMLWTFDTISSFSYPLILLDGAVAQVEMAKFEEKGLLPAMPFSVGSNSKYKRKSLVKSKSYRREQLKADNVDEVSMPKVEDFLLRTDNSVLDVILDSSDPRMMRMIDIPILKHVISRKWTCFGRSIQFRNTLLYTAMMFCTMNAVMLRPHLPANRLRYGGEEDHARAMFEVISLIFALYYAKEEIMDYRELGARKYFHGHGGWPYSINFYWVGILLSAFFRFAAHHAEDVALSMACLSAWTYFLSYLTTFQFPVWYSFETGTVVWFDPDLGELIILLFRMLKNDVSRFMAVNLVVMVGFMYAFVVLFQEALALEEEGSDMHMFRDYYSGISSVWRLSLADFVFTDFERTDDPGYLQFFYKLLWFYSLVVLALTMVNLLIALMTNTFSVIRENVTQQNLHSKARVLRDIEHTLSNKRLRELYEGEFTSKHEIHHKACSSFNVEHDRSST